MAKSKVKIKPVKKMAKGGKIKEEGLRDIDFSKINPSTFKKAEEYFKDNPIPYITNPDIVSRNKESIDFLNDWYSKRLPFLYGQEGLEYLNSEQYLNNLNSENHVRDTRPGADAEAYYLRPKTSLPDWENYLNKTNLKSLEKLPFTKNAAKETLLDKGRSIYLSNLTPNFLNQREYFTHENSHKYDYFLTQLLDKDEKVINKIEPIVNLDLPDSEGWGEDKKYFTTPTEVKSRLMEIRKRFNIIPDKPFLKEDYNKLDKNFTPLDDLRHYYKDDDIINLMNKVSQNNENQNDMPKAKYGGKMKYGSGGKTNPPIYTNNPNDPRLQAYNDSLALYANGRPDGTSKAPSSYPFHTKKQDEAEFRLYKLNGIVPETYTNNHSEYHSKPVQPIIYQAPHTLESEDSYLNRTGKTHDGSGMAGRRYLIDSRTGKATFDGDFGYIPPRKKDYIEDIQVNPYNQSYTQMSPDLNKLDVQPINTRKDFFHVDFPNQDQQGTDRRYFDKSTGKPYQITDEMKNGGKIHIKPSKKGTFTKAATEHGKSVQAFASQVLAHKENYSPAMVKKANFARNASRWKKEFGGNIMTEKLPMMDIGGFWNTTNPNAPMTPQVNQIYVPNPELPQDNTKLIKDPILGQDTYYTPKQKQKPLLPIPPVPQFQFSGNKYFQRAGQHLNNAIQFGSQIPMAENGLQIDDLHNSGFIPLQNSPQNLTLQTLETPYQPPVNQATADKQINNNYKNQFQTAGAIAGTVAETALTGINAGKGILDTIGSQNQNRQQIAREAQMQQQALFQSAIDLRPYNTLGVSNGGSNSVLKNGGIINAPEMGGYFRKKVKKYETG